MFRKIVILAAFLALLASLPFPLGVSADSYLDNSDLMPAYKPDDEVQLIQNGAMLSPEWIDSLILGQMRIDTATAGGTFATAVEALDHFAEMGVNGLWINPVYHPGPTDNGYGNMGPHSIDPKLTGKTDYEEGWKVAKAFVDEAHKRNIRVFFDIITWGTCKSSPVYAEHPEWYAGREAWNGWVWNWNSKPWQDWFAEEACNVIRKTGADGFRVDLEPDNTGYDLFGIIRQRLYNEGHKIIIFSEGPNDRRQTYDFEQSGVGQDLDYDPSQPWLRKDDFFITKYNIVDAVKQGTGIGIRSQQQLMMGGSFKYYTHMATCHDSGSGAIMKGNRFRFAYQTIFSPFIPLFYLGEEWNNPWDCPEGVLYYNKIVWSAMNKPENRAFYEDVKQYLRIRRTHPDIFEYWPDDHRETNICKVDTSGTLCDFQAYARYMNGKAIIIVPNDDTNTTKPRVTIPWQEAALNAKGEYAVTDLMTGKELARGTAEKLKNFRCEVGKEAVGVFLVAPAEVKPDVPVTTTKKPTTTKPTTTVQGKTTAAPVDGETTAPIEDETTAPVEDEPTAPVEGETTAPVTDGTTLPTTVTTTAPVEDAQTMPGFDATPFIIGGIAVAVIVAGVAVLLIIKKKKN